jgi:O-antigen/teichoic acid export membrane protein
MDKLKNSAFNGLKWLERYTKTDMIYLAKGGFWLGIGQVVASGSAFLTSVAFANLLPSDIFGIYKYIISINSLLLITTLSGMDSAIIQSVSRGYDGTLNLGVKTKMKWGLIGSIFSIIIGLYYFSKGNSLLAICFFITAFFIPLSESFDMYNSMLFGKRLFDIQARYNVIKKIISLISVIAVVYLTKNLYTILFIYLFSTVLPNLYFLYKTEKDYKTNNHVDPESITYGKNLSAINIISLILSEIDKVLVFQYVGATDLAIYSLATAPTDQIKGLLKNVNSLALPKFSKRTPDEIRNNIWDKIKILSVVTTIIIVFYILFAPIFYKTFFPKYTLSVAFSQILSISLLPVVVSGFIYTVFESQKAQKQIYKYNIYSSIFGIIILFPMVYLHGLWGAVISKIITRLFIFGLSIRLVKEVD